MKCRKCDGDCKRAGKQPNGAQKFKCKRCGKYQQAKYKYTACKPGTDKGIIACVKEGCGIWNTARLMGIAKGTVLRRIRSIAAGLKPPSGFRQGLVFEVDELHTCIGGKHAETYICYAIERKTRMVVDFVVGPRSKEIIGKLTAKLKKLKPRKVHTDGLNVFRAFWMPKSISQGSLVLCESSART